MKNLFWILITMTLSFQILADDRVSIAQGEELEVVLQKLSLLPQGQASKFAVTSNKELVISTTGEKKTKHDDLAGGDDALTGGYISVVIEENEFKKITLDNFSGRLCPTYESLQNAFEILSSYLGRETEIVLKNHPNIEKCD
ncbi:MAG: hypothetical protein HOE90_12115 [Bacteriovoracaceae bacterium]|nr:hypothetical protein [Bacteriovoracaceae bacterium]